MERTFLYASESEKSAQGQIEFVLFQDLVVREGFYCIGDIRNLLSSEKGLLEPWRGLRDGYEKAGVWSFLFMRLHWRGFMGVLKLCSCRQPAELCRSKPSFMLNTLQLG